MYVSENGKYKLKITLPKISEAYDDYKYVLKFASTSSANYALPANKDNYENNFAVEKKTIGITAEDIVWQYNNQKYTRNFAPLDEELFNGEIYEVTYNENVFEFRLDPNSDVIKTYGDDVNFIISGDESATNVKANDGYYTITLTITAKGDASGLDLPEEPFTLKWKINKAKFDLSTVEWDYTAPLPYNEQIQRVALKSDSIPAGLSFSYDATSKLSGTDIKTYTARIEKFIVDDSYKNNWEEPNKDKPDSYIGENVPWTLQWQIVKGTLTLKWEKYTYTIQTDNGERMFVCARVDSSLKDYIKGYEYYHISTDGEDLPSKIGPKKLEDIEYTAGTEYGYEAVAILDDEWT
ncbi:MAG: hypothetical protein K2J13_03255, partial [Clostridia bacterium]|nr:hypothetical protein [Clostridia bacterium]